MEPGTHTLKDLFDQLGLESDEESIEAFIDAHQLPNEIKLIDADFWTPQQAKFLQEELRFDAEWASLVDALNEALHKPPAS